MRGWLLARGWDPAMVTVWVLLALFWVIFTLAAIAACWST